MVSPAISFFLYDNIDRKFIPLHDGLVCGRTEGELRFPSDPLLSRRHCRFSVRGQVVKIEDLDSTNQTKVNSLKLQSGKERRLQLNDVIELGKRRFILTHQNRFPPANIQDRILSDGRRPALRKADGSLTSQLTRIITKKTMILLSPKTYRDLQIREFSHGKGWDHSTRAVTITFALLYLAALGLMGVSGVFKAGLPHSGFSIVSKFTIIWLALAMLFSLWHYLSVRKRYARTWLRFLFVPLWAAAAILTLPVLDGITSVVSEVGQNLTVHYCLLNYSSRYCSRLTEEELSGYHSLSVEIREKIEARRARD